MDDLWPLIDKIKSYFIHILVFYSKVSRPDKLAVHVFEVDEDVDKDEVSECSSYSSVEGYK